METATITMDETEAQAKLDAMQAVDPRRLTADDLALMKGYKALAKGAALLDLTRTMRAGGVNEQGLPKLAIARADALWVRYSYHETGAGCFADNLHRNSTFTTRIVWLEQNTWTDAASVERLKGYWRSSRRHEAYVPTIPIEHRPEQPLNNFHILWEAEWKRAAPVDPILLRHLSGRLYIVIAQWDLTELEQAVLNERINRRL